MPHICFKRCCEKVFAPSCFAYLSHIHVSDCHKNAILDKDNPSKHKMTFLNDDFIDSGSYLNLPGPM